MLVYFKYLGDPSAILHHLLFMLAAAYVLDQSIMAFPFIWLALGEISTPSVNLRYLSHQSGCDAYMTPVPPQALRLPMGYIFQQPAVSNYQVHPLERA